MDFHWHAVVLHLLRHVDGGTENLESWLRCAEHASNNGAACVDTNSDSEIFWEMFCLTGEPLAYMLYRSAEEERPLP